VAEVFSPQEADLLKDFVYAARTLRKRPVFAVPAVATIARGVGAPTVHRQLLAPCGDAGPGSAGFRGAQLRGVDFSKTVTYTPNGK
jgi:hypothetical protein